MRWRFYSGNSQNFRFWDVGTAEPPLISHRLKLAHTHTHMSVSVCFFPLKKLSIYYLFKYKTCNDHHEKSHCCFVISIIHQILFWYCCRLSVVKIKGYMNFFCYYIWIYLKKKKKEKRN